MTTFISYSRVNSDFAASLAKDLKSAGFDVWLDQLDIPTGARWDDEIEKALEVSSTFLIILSPESIQSQNVKDEIGYAIDSGKHILPVVIENCKVPFRLRRFQYVDFSGNSYQQSLSKIKILLGNTQEMIAARKDKDNTETEDTQPRFDNSNIQENPASVDAKWSGAKKPDSKWTTKIPVIAVGVILIALAIIFKDRFVAKEAVQIVDAGFTPVVQIPTSAPVTETPTPIPASETPTPDLSTATPLPDEFKDVGGVTMRLVPAGDFIMGSDTGELDERPVHNIYLDAYYIDKYEVTNVLYSACAAEGVCDPPKRLNSFASASYYGNPQFNDYPVINVDWGMAKTYCEWRGAQLPTEAQWEKASRGTDGRTYPWGEVAECFNANYGVCVKDTNFIGSKERGKSVYGVYDMAGNVWEWVADWYSADYYQNSPASNPLGPDAGALHVLRGGSWADLGSSGRSANRYSVEPLMYGNSIGIRCATSVP